MMEPLPKLKDQDFQTILCEWLRILMLFAKAKSGILINLDGEDLQILVQGNERPNQLEIEFRETRLDQRTFLSSAVQQVLKTSSELIVDTTTPLKDDDKFPKRPHNADLSSYMCIPVTFAGQKLGALYLEDLGISSPYSSDSLSFIRLMCSQAALAISNMRFFAALKSDSNQEAETSKLWDEIKRRRQSEMKLEKAQRQLIQILDTSNEAIVAFNHDYKITFFNRKAEEMFGYTFQELSGHSIANIFPELEEELRSGEHTGIIKKLTTSPDYIFPYRYIVKSGKLDGESLHLVVVPLKGESGYVLTVDDDASSHESSPQTLKQWEDTFSTLIELVVRDQPQLLKQFRPMPDNLDQILDMPGRKERTKPLREVLVEIMNLSLSYWGLTTQRSKGELAEESKIWHSSIDSLGAFRTRTLDRYLKFETIPQNPNWRNVFLTAQFVLQFCPDTAPELKEELRAQLEKAKSMI